MLSRIDRYILRQFVQTFVFSVLAFVTIFIVVNLIEQLDTFTDRKLTAGEIATYYLYFIPEIVKLVTPIAMLLAGLFTFGRLDSTHELTAIRTGGRSMGRIALPLLLFGLLIAVGMIAFSGWVVPAANASRYLVEREKLGTVRSGGAGNVFMRVSPTLTLQIDYFDPKKSTANTVSLERIDTAATLLVPRVGGEGSAGTIDGVDTITSIAVVERIDAMKMEYDSAGKTWHMIDGVARNLRDPEKVVTTTFERREIPGLDITPESMNSSQQVTDEMTVEELKSRLERERKGGRDVRSMEIDYHSRFSLPFAAFIVVFFGLPFTSAQRKGGAAVPIALTALISAIYLIFTEVSKTLSFTADVPPVVTAWLANGIFLLLGLVNIWRASRS